MSGNDWLVHEYGSLREDLLFSLRPEVFNYRHGQPWGDLWNNLHTEIVPTLQQVSRVAIRLAHEGSND